jgi:hypothetical protein
MSGGGREGQPDGQLSLCSEGGGRGPHTSAARTELNKPDPALLRPSNLSNEIKKRAPKSRETIPLNKNIFYSINMYCTVHARTRQEQYL